MVFQNIFANLTNMVCIETHEYNLISAIPLYICGCMFRVAVLPEGEPPPQSQVAGSWLSPMLVSYLALCFPVPPEQVHPHSMMLPPPSFNLRDSVFTECTVSFPPHKGLCPDAKR
ncbi:hypothetical protein AMECASPLE_027802 [Ameca splendens]|uniref:Uncharacterized protein n=1 Tax=Ameca splendens TaxID=208324 RepID=A0ABV0Y566_9TELE